MPFVIGGRVALAIRSGPFEGAEAEVDALQSGFQRQLVAHRASAFLAAAAGSAEELTALDAMCETFASEGRPVWNLVDVRGPVPPTAGGMLRVDAALLLAFLDLWTEPEPEV